jgi:hypothetical protein
VITANRTADRTNDIESSGPTTVARSSKRASTVRIMGATQVPVRPISTTHGHAPTPAPTNFVDFAQPIPARIAAERLHPAGRYRSAVRLRLA